jgi:hypothetical protein
MMQCVTLGDPCLTVLNGYGISLITTGFDVGIGNITSNWTLRPYAIYVIFVYFGLTSPLLLSILFGVGNCPVGET